MVQFNLLVRIFVLSDTHLRISMLMYNICTCMPVIIPLPSPPLPPDFGVSSWLYDTSSLPASARQKAQRFTFVGTPCWMAPEVMDQVSPIHVHLLHCVVLPLLQLTSHKGIVSALRCTSVVATHVALIVHVHSKLQTYQIQWKVDSTTYSGNHIDQHFACTCTVHCPVRPLTQWC